METLESKESVFYDLIPSQQIIIGECLGKKGEQKGNSSKGPSTLCYYYSLLCAQLLQSCPTLGNPMDCSLPASSVHGTFLGRILEWVTISSSRASSLLPDPGVEPGSPVSLALQAASLSLSHQGNPSFSLIQTRNSWHRRQMCCTVGYR